MIVIADSSALIALAACSALEILVALYDEVYVPRSVYEEVSQPNKPQAVVLSQFLQSRVVDVDKKKMIIAAEITPFVEQLRHSPLHYSEALLTRVQQLAGEL